MSHGSGDASVVWGIGLEAQLSTGAPSTDLVRRRLDALVARHPHLRGADLTQDDLPSMASEPFVDAALRVALTDDTVRIAGHHEAIDGLGLLSVLAAVLDTPVTSSARGLGERPARPFVAAATRRVAEAVFAPPAVFAPRGRRTPVDVLVRTTVQTTAGSGDLVVAAARALHEWNRARGERGSRVAVAVGASRRSGEEAAPVDASAYLRLTRVERLGADLVTRQLRELPAEPASAPGSPSGPVAAATRLLSRRLGSTVLVSHLGKVTGDGVERLDFYPVTGGRSGLSLGAATIRDTTTLTLRARGGEHSTEELRELLDLARRQVD